MIDASTGGPVKAGTGCLVFVTLVAVVGIVAAAFTPTPGEIKPSTITVTGRAPASVALRERFSLIFDITNTGDRDISDVGVKVSSGYIGGMVVVGTEPRARYDNEASAKRFYFGPLKRGDTGRYRISVVPTRPGDFNAIVRFTDGHSLVGPLTLLSGDGPAEWSASTTVRE